MIRRYEANLTTGRIICGTTCLMRREDGVSIRNGISVCDTLARPCRPFSADHLPNSFSLTKGALPSNISGPVHVTPVKRHGRQHPMSSPLPALDFANLVLPLQLASQNLRKTFGFGKHSENSVEGRWGGCRWTDEQVGGGRVDRGLVERR